MTQGNIAHHQNNISAVIRCNQYSSAWYVMALCSVSTLCPITKNIYLCSFQCYK